jgi:hypothetical protein
VTIEFSDHSKQMMKERNITEELVTQAIKAPDSVSVSYRSRKLYRKKVQGKILEVVTSQESGKILVVTQYFLGG